MPDIWIEILPTIRYEHSIMGTLGALRVAHVGVHRKGDILRLLQKKNLPRHRNIFNFRASDSQRFLAEIRVTPPKRKRFTLKQFAILAAHRRGGVRDERTQYGQERPFNCRDMRQKLLKCTRILLIPNVEVPVTSLLIPQLDYPLFTAHIHHGSYAVNQIFGQVGKRDSTPSNGASQIFQCTHPSAEGRTLIQTLLPHEASEPVTITLPIECDSKSQDRPSDQGIEMIEQEEELPQRLHRRGNLPPGGGNGKWERIAIGRSFYPVAAVQNSLTDLSEDRQLLPNQLGVDPILIEQRETVGTDVTRAHLQTDFGLPTAEVIHASTRF